MPSPCLVLIQRLVQSQNSDFDPPARQPVDVDHGPFKSGGVENGMGFPRFPTVIFHFFSGKFIIRVLCREPGIPCVNPRPAYPYIKP